MSDDPQLTNMIVKYFKSNYQIKLNISYILLRVCFGEVNIYADHVHVLISKSKETLFMSRPNLVQDKNSDDKYIHVLYLWKWIVTKNDKY